MVSPNLASSVPPQTSFLLVGSSLFFSGDETFILDHLEELLDQSPSEKVYPLSEVATEVQAVLEPLLRLSFNQVIHPFVQPSVTLVINLLRMRDNSDANHFGEMGDYLQKILGYVFKYTNINTTIAKADSMLDAQQQLHSQLLKLGA